MNRLTDEEIYQAIAQIIENFDILECDWCAKAIMQWLENNQLQGQVIEIRTKNPREYFILSLRLEKLGITESITLNGKHYGVEVKGLVFDNLSSEGMTRENWLKDFYCPSEEFIINDLLEF